MFLNSKFIYIGVVQMSILDSISDFIDEIEVWFSESTDDDDANIYEFIKSKIHSAYEENREFIFEEISNQGTQNWKVIFKVLNQVLERNIKTLISEIKEDSEYSNQYLKESFDFVIEELSKKIDNSIKVNEAYKLLELEPGSSKEEISASYKNLIKKVHPDVGGNIDLTIKINKAKDILLNEIIN